MDISKLNDDVLGAVRQTLDCEEEDDNSKDGQITAMEPLEVLSRYLQWNGIIGYASTIWDAVECIKEAAGE